METICLNTQDELLQIARKLIETGEAKTANELKNLLKIGFGRAILLWKEATK